MDFDDLLPRPVSVSRADGSFTLTPGTTIGVDDGTARAGTWLAGLLGLRVADDGPVRFRLDPTVVPHAEGYRLEITPGRVLVLAADASGAHYAAQTLRQLCDVYRVAPVFDGATLQCGVVADHPRFAWRGALLDVARHFLPKADVLRFVDLLAVHRLNVLHLHLTDDQGWRIEIPGLPMLTEVGAWRTESMVGSPPDARLDGTPHGGYYPAADLREIVAYAADRGITVVPEVDVPGHTQAAIAAYPELGNDPGARLPVWTSWGICENVLNVEESTVDFFRTVFDHVVDVFPGTVIGVGGDEVPLSQWEHSDAAMRRRAELGLRETGDLHGWFVTRMVDHLAEHGRRALGWDEIAGVGPVQEGTIIASWRGERAGIEAARAGFDVVMCPEQHVYLDHRQSADPDEPIPVGHVHTLEDVYRYEPVPDGLTGPDVAHVLGAQAQLWTEHLDSVRRLDYAAFPRLAAFAEVVWSPAEARDLDDFLRRLTGSHLNRLDALGVEYRPLDGPHPWQRRPGVPGRPR